jgi:hypothetical protein
MGVSWDRRSTDCLIQEMPRFAAQVSYRTKSALRRLGEIMHRARMTRFQRINLGIALALVLPTAAALYPRHWLAPFLLLVLFGSFIGLELGTSSYLLLRAALHKSVRSARQAVPHSGAGTAEQSLISFTILSTGIAILVFALAYLIPTCTYLVFHPGHGSLSDLIFQHVFDLLFGGATVLIASWKLGISDFEIMGTLSTQCQRL